MSNNNFDSKLPSFIYGKYESKDYIAQLDEESVKESKSIIYRHHGGNWFLEFDNDKVGTAKIKWIESSN